MDSSGLAVPGAQVEVTQTSTGLTRATVTGVDGTYVLSSLPVGPYKLEVKKEGFATFVQTGIVLQVDTNPTIEVTLKVGSVSEQVQVEASAAMVKPTPRASARWSINNVWWTCRSTAATSRI